MGYKITVAIVGLSCLGGCDRTDSASPTAATTRRAVPTTQSMLMIDGKPVQLGPARMQAWLEQNICLLLTTAEEKDHSTGSTLYLRMTLEIDDLQTLDGAQWNFKADNLERAETPNGIFLEGDQQLLQPLDVTVKFTVQRDAQSSGQDMVTATFDGQFGLFASIDSETVDRTVEVTGTLTALLPR